MSTNNEITSARTEVQSKSTRWLVRACVPIATLSLAWTSAFAAIATANRIPFTMDVGCGEREVCNFYGVREVWYGTNFTWRYGVFKDSVPCTNATFGDPAPGVFKRCYLRSLQDAGVLPAKLDTIEAVFNGDDLISTEGGRYTLETIISGARHRVVTPYVVYQLTSLPVPDSQTNNKTFYQFLITDTASGPISYNVFIASTSERCLVQRAKSATEMDFSFGRYMELYSLIANPVSGKLPLRSDTQRICTQDKGKLAFYFKPPSVDSFQIKVVSHESAGNSADVTDFFIPTKAVNALP